MDHHWSHRTFEVRGILNAIGIDVYYIPKSATDLFSVLDIAINKPFKDILKELFGNYCCDQTLQQLRNGALPRDVVLDVRASVVKDEFSGWVLIAMAKLQEKAFDMITAGWRKVDENMEACLQKNNGNAVEVVDVDDE
ncbi:hypothetical protein P9112_006968 [Eukaryota sp. TZLM1-RC]